MQVTGPCVETGAGGVAGWTASWVDASWKEWASISPSPALGTPTQGPGWAAKVPGGIIYIANNIHDSMNNKAV